MSRFDDDDEAPGPVVVGRTAYDAGMKLEAEVKAGVHGPAFENARDKALKCRAAGDARRHRGRGNQKSDQASCSSAAQ